MFHYLIPFAVLVLCCIYMPLEADAEATATAISDDETDSQPLLKNAYQHTPRHLPEQRNNLDAGIKPGNESPEKTVDRIAAKANDWHEPSKKSEEKYVFAIRQWLDGLEPFQREKVRRILRDAHPDMRALRTAIREKKMELANLSFDHGTNPETLPRLGQQLQDLRKALRLKLDALGKRLKYEAGVSMGPLGGDGFWLVPPQEEKAKTPSGGTPPHSDSNHRSPLAFMPLNALI